MRTHTGYSRITAFTPVPALPQRTTNTPVPALPQRTTNGRITTTVRTWPCLLASQHQQSHKTATLTQHDRSDLAMLVGIPAPAK
ncbi:hypothetical protein OUZ56_026219 [Daphnia magna]|uniref:Uncharacterized protein n=1 Tax=Daphnia magna TaxID=35525 RepID=A0ABQ9ZL62_9CRUS|nr:hypothetical protein OUZ56_026219 [Daphnia magna]